jgi:uncharacterized protein
MLGRPYFGGKRIVLLLAFLLIAGPQSLMAASRVALLIGNQGYHTVGALNNPFNDVALMKKSLETAGFDSVTTVLDANVNTLRKALRSFEDIASGAEVAVIYYSGHGMEMNGTNYLIPVDAVLESDKDVEDETISLDRATRALEGASKLKLVILDACRNNPFLETMERSISKRALHRGLAKVEPESSNMLVAFAAKAGSEALDGEGSNSPFATALSKYLIEPGLDIRIALGKVRDEVLKLTNAQQEPFVYGSLGGAQIVLNINQLNLAINTGNDKPEVPAATLSTAATDWQNIRDLADQELLTAFLDKHGDDPVYRMLAEKKIKQLEQASKSLSAAPDQIAWDTLKGSTDVAALRRFMERYPDSTHRKDVETQLASLQPAAGQTDPLYGMSAAARDCYTDAGEPQSLPGFMGVDFDDIDTKRAITACAQAVNEKPDDAMLINLLGRAYDSDEDYEPALRHYQKATDLGNMYALTNLGWLSVSGDAVPQDLKKAVAQMEKAALAGNAYAKNSLGDLYRDGYEGLPQDNAKALKWYQQAADLGYAEAMGNLGLIYREGKGVDKDYDKSLAWYRKAADLGNVDAISSVGYAYENGFGVPENYAEAKVWYERAASAGDAFAMGELGFIYETGKSVDLDYTQARYWYEKAADAGNSYAMGNLARIYDNGLGTKIDPAEAARWAIASIESGDVDKRKDLKETPDDFSRDFRKQVQTQLKARGLYKGAVTGTFDAATQKALDKLFAQNVDE